MGAAFGLPAESPIWYGNLLPKGVAMNSNKLSDPISREVSQPTVREIVLKDRLMKDAIFVYGMGFSLVAGVCGLVIFFNL